MRQITHIVAGLGQVGSAISEVLSSGGGNRVVGYDPAISPVLPDNSGVAYLHICFPHGPTFKNDADFYIGHYDPDVVIVHSTVPAGTTRSLMGGDAVHSPIEGLHPYLIESIKTFTKHFGGKHAGLAAAPFVALGVSTSLHNRPETTELAKLLSTSAYGIMLILAKEQADICRQYGLSYHEVVSEYTRTYNEGYATLDHPQFTRPILTPPQGKIGGHCLVQNANLVFDALPEVANLHGMLARYNEHQT